MQADSVFCAGSAAAGAGMNLVRLDLAEEFVKEGEAGAVAIVMFPCAVVAEFDTASERRLRCSGRLRGSRGAPLLLAGISEVRIGGED